MKNTFFTYLLIAISGILNAQSIPNGDFEQWTNFHFNEPDNWYTSNTETVHSNEWITVLPVQGVEAQGHGIRLMTDGENSRVMPGYISNTYGDPLVGQGGAPYNERPTFLSGYWRFHTLYNDTALIAVVFKKDGLIISQQIFKIHGQQMDWHPFDLLLSVNETPDSVIFAATSSNVLNESVMQTGSYLDLDNLEFRGRFITDQIANSDFESWFPRDIHHAQGWRVMGRDVDWTDDTPYGNHGVRMSSWIDNDGIVHASGIGTGDMNDMGEWSGGLPYHMVLDTLRGYYRYECEGEDNGYLSLEMLNNNLSIGGAYYHFYPVDTWTYFEIPLHLNIAPDTLRLQLGSTDYPFDEAIPGSTLYIDNLQLSSQPLHVGSSSIRSFKPPYPNPAVALIHVPLPDDFRGEVLFSIFDESGKLVKTMNFHQAGSVLRVPLDEFNSGNYVYEMRSAEWLYSGRFTKR